MKALRPTSTAVVALFVALSCAGIQIAAPSPFRELTAKERPKIEGYDDFHLYTTGRGYLLTKDTARAPKLYAEIARGAQEFKRRFGKEAAPVLVLETPSGTKWDPKSFEVLKTESIYPLIAPGSTNEVNNPEEARKSYRKHYKDNYPNLTEAQLERAVENAMKKISKTDEAHGLDILAHELGHQWFHDSFWKGVPPRGTVVDGKTYMYGSPADDYLDECAAILMEPAHALESRWSYFRKIYADPNRRAELLPLSKLVKANHPKNGPNASQSTGFTSATFYAQCLALAEYLFEKTKNDRILIEITNAAVAGKDFEVWLRANGTKYGLSPDIATLDKEWNLWIEARLTAQS